MVMLGKVMFSSVLSSTPCTKDILTTIYRVYEHQQTTRCIGRQIRRTKTNKIILLQAISYLNIIGTIYFEVTVGSWYSGSAKLVLAVLRNIGIIYKTQTYRVFTYCKNWPCEIFNKKLAIFWFKILHKMSENTWFLNQ